MSYVNKVILIGNLGTDPDILKEDVNGKFVRISLATTRKYRDAKNEVQQDTQWHTVYFSNGLGKAVAEYAHKGDKVFVCGSLRKRSWQDKQNATHYETAVYAQEMQFLTPKAAEKLAAHTQVSAQALSASEDLDLTDQ